MEKGVIAIIFASAIVAWCFFGYKQHQIDKLLPPPVTTIKVFYQNGDVETLTIKTYPNDIWLMVYRGSSRIEYLPPGNQGFGKTVVSGVRRFEIVSSNYKVH